VLENVQQHRCQEIFNKISSQEIFLPCRKFLSSCIQECRIIYLLFKKASCADTEVYHNVRHTLTYTGNSYFSILLPGREMYFLGLLLLIQTRFLKSRNISKCINKLLGSLLWIGFRTTGPLLCYCRSITNDRNIFTSNKDQKKLTDLAKSKLNRTSLWFRVNKRSLNIEKTNFTVLHFFI
jgi:hypothetical protein